MSIKVCHITSVHQRYDTRIFHKECTSLANAGYNVTLLVADGKKEEVRNGVKIVSANSVPTSRYKRIPLIRAYYPLFKDVNVTVLGLTFKPGTDDLRETPSIVNVAALLDENANIKAWDPVEIENFKKLFPEGITYCETIPETLSNTDICFIFTKWPEVSNSDADMFAI